MGILGYITYFGSNDKRTKFAIVKQSVTFGKCSSNDIRIHNRSVLDKHAELILKSKDDLSEDKANFDYIFNVFGGEFSVKLDLIFF